MLEFIGFVVVAIFVFGIIRGVIRAVLRVKGQELNRDIGREVREISTAELRVPTSYHNHIVLHRMAAARNSAQYLQENDPDFETVPWPRLLALIIYGEFRQECEQYYLGNPQSQQMLSRLSVSDHEISSELDRDPQQVIYGAI